MQVDKLMKLFQRKNLELLWKYAEIKVMLEEAKKELDNRKLKSY